jgi:hypothetical protein
MHQVLGVDVAARERAGVAAESRQLAEHVERGRALKRHDPYTELEAELVRQGFKSHIVTHVQREAGWCCVKKVRERHAVREMKEDPSEPSCRGRLQTAMSCFGQKLR